MPDAQTIFSTVDALDARGVVALMAEDATMVFGNAEPLHGRDAILAAHEVFLATIKGLRHRLLNEWTVGADSIAETEVTYTRIDGKEVTVPAVSIWRVGEDGLIVSYRIFYDIAPLFAP